MAELEPPSDELKDRYEAAVHAMQSGVAAKIAMHLGRESEPKHLRVGVNSALVDTGTLARLLIRKGVFTSEEFYTALAENMEAEAATYERELGAKLI